MAAAHSSVVTMPHEAGGPVANTEPETPATLRCLRWAALAFTITLATVVCPAAICFGTLLTGFVSSAGGVLLAVACTTLVLSAIASYKLIQACTGPAGGLGAFCATERCLRNVGIGVSIAVAAVVSPILIGVGVFIIIESRRLYYLRDTVVATGIEIIVIAVVYFLLAVLSAYKLIHVANDSVVEVGPRPDGVALAPIAVVIVESPPVQGVVVVDTSGDSRCIGEVS